jgi:hypothetical protein
VITTGSATATIFGQVPQAPLDASAHPDRRVLDLILNAATVLGWLFSTVFAVALAPLGGSE